MIRRLARGALAVALPVSAATGAIASAATPRTILATAIPANGKPYARPGTPVRGSGLGNRVFVTRSRGFALWRGGGVTYPACTATAGRTWVICGPHLHVNAANAPNVVTQVGARGHEYFTYGGPDGAQSIVVSSNRRTWYRAYMPGVPYAVSAGRNGTLFAFVVSGRTSSECISSNGGRTWRRG